MTEQTPAVEVPFQTFPPISREQLRDYAAASEDPNPIHLDDEVAKKMGLPGIIAHGMLVAALIAERAQRYVKQELKTKAEFRGELGWLQLRTRFKGMVFLGDVLSIGGNVKDWDEKILTLDLKVKNQKGEVTTTGLAKFSLKAAFR